jgi:hypothetical protein
VHRIDRSIVVHKRSFSLEDAPSYSLWATCIRTGRFHLDFSQDQILPLKRNQMFA